MVVIRQARIPDMDDRAPMQHVDVGLTLVNKPKLTRPEMPTAHVGRLLGLPDLKDPILFRY
jgi:hypothetical protein